MQIIFWHKKAFCALTPQLRQIHLTNSRHFDESWVSGVTITGNNDINYNGMLRAKLLFYESFWKRKWASSPPASVVREERSPRSLLMSRWVEANSGSWVSDFAPLVHPAEDPLLPDTTEGWSLCVFMTPSRSSLKKGDKVILPVSSFSALAITFSHTRNGGEEKKEWQRRRAMKLKGKKKQVEAQWRMGGSVCVCVCVGVYSRHVCTCSLVRLGMMTLSRLKSIGTP